MGKVSKGKNTCSSGKRYLCGTASLRAISQQGVKPPHSLSEWHWLFLWEKRPPAAVTHRARQRCQSGGCQGVGGGSEEWGEGWAGRSHSAWLLYIFCSLKSSNVVYSSTCNVQLHPIALTTRHSSSGPFESMTMTLFNKVGALQLFFSSLQGRTRPYKAEWLVACQGILKNSSLPRRTCLFFPGSLGSLFLQ